MLNKIKSLEIKSKSHLNKGITLIELMVCMALIALLSFLLLRVFTPIKNTLTYDVSKLQDFKQVLFANQLLDSLVRMADSVSIETRSEDGNQTLTVIRGVLKVQCNIKHKNFGCDFSRANGNGGSGAFFIPIVKAETISIRQSKELVPITIDVALFRLQFGFFPQVSLL